MSVLTADRLATGAGERWWSNPRALIFTAAVAMMVAGAFDITSRALFQQPDTLKYAMTVAGPGLIAGLATTRRPLRLLVGLALVVAPFDIRASLGGADVTPLMAVLALATPLAAVTVGGGRSKVWLGSATIAAGLLLAPAVAGSSAPTSYVEWLIETILTGWLVFAVAREPGGVRFVLLMLALTAFTQAALAIYEYRSGHVLNLYSGSGVGSVGGNYFYNYGSATRSAGALPDPIALGNVLAIITPLIVCLAVWERRPLARLGLAVAGAVTALGVILTFSRMSWFGAAAGALLCVVLLPGRARLATVLGLAVTLIGVGAVGASFGGKDLGRRLTSAFNPTNTQSSYVGTALADRERVRLWRAAVQIAEGQPLGTGFGRLVPQLDRHGVSVPAAANSQSWYLEITAEAGILGAVALVGLIAAGVRDLMAGFRRHRVFAAGASGAFLAMLVTWTTDVSPRYVQVSAIIAALFGCIAAQASVSPGFRSALIRRLRRSRATLVLATPSAPREAILRQFGVPFTVRPAGARNGEKFRPPGSVSRHPARRAVAIMRASPTELARRRALEQALTAVTPGTRDMVIGASTVVTLGGRVCAEPRNEHDARAMLQSMSGTTHEVVGGLALVWSGGVKVATTTTSVTLRELRETELERYLASGAWRGRPGGYAGADGDPGFVQRIAGDPDYAHGLSVATLLELVPRGVET